MKASLGGSWIQRSGAWLRLGLKLEHVGRFALYTIKRFSDDGCPRQAAGLGYISLLSIVPLMAIVLGVLAAFPAFGDIRDQLQDLVFQNFLPATSETVLDQLQAFIDNASKATVPGVIAFAVTAVMLLNSITSALNAIWRVAEPRHLAVRLLVYWALLSLGPLLVGSSLSMSSYAFAMVEFAGVERYTGSFLNFTRIISFTLATVGFGLIYLVVPNRAVRLHHAFIGGVVAAAMLEALKIGFGVYLRNFPTYQAIYGALSAVPIFLVWMYLSWAVILLGAEVAAALPEWSAAQARGRHAASPGQQLALALGLVARLRRASRSDGPLRERRLVRNLPATPAEIDATLKALRRCRIVERSIGGRWTLARDLSTVTLDQFSKLLGLELEPGQGWPKAAEQAVEGLVQSSRDQLNLSLAELLEEPESE